MTALRIAPILVAGLALTSSCIAAHLSSKDASKQDIEKLIDGLVGLSSWSRGYSPFGFDNDEPDPTFPQNLTPTHADRCEQALLKLGPKAIPALLAHVTDARETKSTLISYGNSAISMVRYQPRYKWKPIVASLPDYGRRSERSSTSYTLRVGDICYSMIGNIVNRLLVPAFNHKTLVVASPVENPDLANAIRRDWSDLTEEDYRQYLIDEIYANPDDWQAQAFSLLTSYYPQDAEKVAIKLLNRPLFDDSAASDYLDIHLLASDDPSWWRSKNLDFQRRYGALAESMLPYLLTRDSDETYYEGKYLRTMFPSFNPLAAGMPPAAGPGEMSTIVTYVANLKAREIDDAVQSVFRRAIAFRNAGSVDQVQSNVDDLALACVGRMAGKGHDQEYRTYFETRIRELGTGPEVKPFESWLSRLKR